ncbi:MAG: hypothetical protein HC788_10750 [Sphingopyxis sp.]|nr:hypothetical protein [Sphingopyxis sp.]
MKNHSLPRYSTLALGGTLLALTSLAQAAPIASDTFDYPSGVLSGNGSAGDGWAGGWTGPNTSPQSSNVNARAADLHPGRQHPRLEQYQQSRRRGL